MAVYTTRVEGQKPKLVECEECGHEYGYTIYARASGTGSSPFMLDNRGAESRSAREANANLAEMLRTGCLPIPCPKCGHYQSDMVAVYQSEQHLAMWYVALGLCVPGGLGVLLAAFPGRMSGGGNLGAGLVLLFVSAVAAAAVFIVRLTLTRKIDPNDLDVDLRIRRGKRLAMGQKEFLRTFYPHRLSAIQRPTDDAPLPMVPSDDDEEPMLLKSADGNETEDEPAPEPLPPPQPRRNRHDDLV